MAGPVLAWYSHLLCTEGPAAVHHAHTLYPSYIIGDDDSCS
ncbi:hypothetical protein [Nocardioides maradonensis]